MTDRNQKEESLIVLPGFTEKKDVTVEDLILSGSSSPTEMWSNYEQTVFCLDTSGSMCGSLKSDEDPNFSPPLMKVECTSCNGTGKVVVTPDPDSEEEDDADGTCLMCSGIGSVEKVIPITAKTKTLGYISKINLLKKALERYIQDRFQKNPDSMLGLVSFESSAHVLIEMTNDEKELVRQVENIWTGGSTNMAMGMYRAINLIGRSKKNWIPRIVLMSDGAADNQDDVVDVISQYQDKRIIIDCIYIGAGGNDIYIEFLKQIAERTGGIFEQITSESEFEQKFLKVANRKLLGTGLAQLGSKK